MKPHKYTYELKLSAKVISERADLVDEAIELSDCDFSEVIGNSIIEIDKPLSTGDYLSPSVIRTPKKEFDFFWHFLLHSFNKLEVVAIFHGGGNEHTVAVCTISEIVTTQLTKPSPTSEPY